MGQYLRERPGMAELAEDARIRTGRARWMLQRARDPPQSARVPGSC